MAVKLAFNSTATIQMFKLSNKSIYQRTSYSVAFHNFVYILTPDSGPMGHPLHIVIPVQQCPGRVLDLLPGPLALAGRDVH